jgi:NAD(P)H dehydrogenase (quinone)
MIVITGATGHVGGEAARLLIESGVEVKLLVRDAARAAHLGAAHVVEGDFADPQRVADALNPGDRVFMVSLYETHDERMRKHTAFVEAARQAGVAQLAYLSFVNAATDAVFIHSVSHAETEDMIRASGVPFTFLRTSLYQASAPHMFDQGLCAAPGGNGATGWVSRRDIGAAVAGALRTAGHEGTTYNLTGPEALTFSQTADRINSLLGTRLAYEDVDDFDRLLTKGLPDPIAMKESRRSCFYSIRADEMSLVTDDIRTLSGVAAAPIDRHILNYREQLLACDR